MVLYFLDFKQNQTGEYIWSINKLDLTTGKIIVILENESQPWPCRLLIWQNQLYYGQIVETESNLDDLNINQFKFIEL